MGESPREVDKKPPDNNNQITQNIKDLLASREIENIFENSDFIYMLNQASGDRQILAKQLNISPTQLSYGQSRNAGVVTIKKICDGLDITIQEFFEDPIFADLEPEL